MRRFVSTMSKWPASIGPGAIVAALACLVTVGAVIFAEHQNRTISYERSRTAVSEQLGRVRAKLEGNIASNVQLVRGLIAVIETKPDLDQAYFSRIASSLIGNHSQLRNIGAAPDLVIRFMYPIKGNEQAIGLDYRANDKQRAAALRAVNSRELVLAGPVNLLQGGQGFIGRFPVFINGDENRLWGLVSAVIDVERLYAASGLRDPELPIRIAIMGQDAAEEDRRVFFGDPDIFSANPVVTDVSLPTGRWRLAAVPRDGWAAGDGEIWFVRLLLMAGGVFLVLLIGTAGRLYDQRREHVRKLHERQTELQRLSRRLDLALGASRIGFWQVNLATMKLRWDKRMKELYGLSPSALAVDTDVWRLALHPDDRERAEEEFEVSITDESPYTSEFRIVLPGGEVRSIRAIGVVHREADNEPYIFGVNWDVTDDVQLKAKLLDAKRTAEAKNRELEEARAQMEHNSLHDSLTGLPNRRYLDQKLSNGGNNNLEMALLHVDLDRFKHINDTLGHAAGDAMLIHAAAVLTANVSDNDIVARIGGDEFVIAITGSVSEERLSQMAERIIEQMREPVPYMHHECRFGASIGIAAGGRRQGDALKHLLIDADIALYRAKKDGRNRYAFFTEALKDEAIQNKRLADEILTGLERGEFVPFFQPQFDARTLDIVGVEALARWQPSENDVRSPNTFLRIADELNVVPLIDRTILEQALWQQSRWQAAGINISSVSVNVSPRQLKSREMIDGLAELVAQPERLSFELLESTFLDDDDEVIIANVEALRQMGIAIEIDDFGTGHASIVSLIRLRPTRLKIERELIAPIMHSENQRRLVASIIEIGHSLGISVLAEGVETMEHAAILRDLGCDSLQGFALGRPMASSDLMAFVRDQRWRKVA